MTKEELYQKNMEFNDYLLNVRDFKYHFNLDYYYLDINHIEVIFDGKIKFNNLKTDKTIYEGYVSSIEQFEELMDLYVPKPKIYSVKFNKLYPAFNEHECILKLLEDIKNMNALDFLECIEEYDGDEEEEFE